MKYFKKHLLMPGAHYKTEAHSSIENSQFGKWFSCSKWVFCLKQTFSQWVERQINLIQATL